MPGKKNDHTGFRNGKLFCYNCGTAFDPQLPQPLSFSAELMKLFAKHHKSCPKTWEPKPPPPTTDIEIRKHWWITSMDAERGSSSEAIFYTLSSDSIHIKKNLRHPYDPDDFRRCYLLLQLIPEWKKDLVRMKASSPAWSNLVDHWDELTAMLEAAMKTKSGLAPEMHRLMKELIGEKT